MMNPRLVVAAVTALIVLGGAAPPDLPLQAEPAGRPLIIPASELERAILRFVDGPTLGTEAALVQAVLASTVYLKVDDTTLERDPGSEDSGRDLHVWTFTPPNGDPALAIYSGKERLGAAFPEENGVAYVAVSGRTAFEMAGQKKSAVALNWGLNPQIYWDPEVAQKFLSTSVMLSAAPANEAAADPPPHNWITPPARSAKDGRASYLTGATLLEVCAKDADLCTFYIMGVIDGQLSTTWITTRDVAYCIPAGTEAPQVREVILAYLKTHPPDFEWTAGVPIANALRRAWPQCP